VSCHGDCLEIHVSSAALAISHAPESTWGLIKRSEHTVRTGGCATIGIVPELMDVHATLSVWVIALDIPGDGGWRGFGALLEGHMASDLGVSSDDGNCEEGLSAKWCEGADGRSEHGLSGSMRSVSCHLHADKQSNHCVMVLLGWGRRTCFDHFDGVVWINDFSCKIR
jgi:hypothetical protein